MDYPTSCQRLMERVNYERFREMPYGDRSLRLQRMRRLLDELGTPHLGLPVVHIAGTKGKGSTASIAAAILTASGYRTGLYTSPHIERIEERLTIDGRECPATEFADLMSQVWPAVETLDRTGSPPTFFEIITAAAFLMFAQARVDVAVMEVGLGGRLDSTNVCQPAVCVITNISRDHTRQLGRSLADIAAEKAGILKPHVPIVSGVAAADARDVVRLRAIQCGAPLDEWNEQFGLVYHGLDGDRATLFDYWHTSPDRPVVSYPRLRLNLLGEHQALNASIALAALHRLADRWDIGEQAIRSGLQSVVCPARIEVVRRAPLVILDTAHNAASARALRLVLQQSFPPIGRKYLFLTATQGKDIRGILRELLPYFDRVLLTRYRDNPRGYDPQALYRQTLQVMGELPAEQRPTVSWYDKPQEAWKKLESQVETPDAVCVTGSFFFAAEARLLIDQLTVPAVAGS